MEYTWILAQTDGAPSRVESQPLTGDGEANTVVPGGPTEPTDARQRTTSPWMQLLPLLLIFVVMYVLLLRGPRKQQQQHKQMVQTLKKNDRVRTIGGILGTVVDIRDDEVILKVDESNNTKIRFSTSAVSKNLSEEGKDQG